MGLFFNRKKAVETEKPKAETPKPEPTDVHVVEAVVDDPRQHYVVDPPRLRQSDDGTSCIEVRAVIYHQDEIAAIEGDTTHVKLKMCAANGERFYELYTDSNDMLGYISAVTIDRYLIKTRGGIDVRIIKPKRERERYGVVIPVSQEGVTNAEKLDGMNISMRLDEKWWCDEKIESYKRFGTCRILIHEDGSAKPQLFVAYKNSILFTVNSRMKPYKDLFEHRAHVISQIKVWPHTTEFGVMYGIEISF